MTVEEAFVQLALADATVTAQVAARLYPNQAPQGAARDYAVYQQADRGSVMTHGGPVATNQYTLDLAVYSDTKSSAKATARAFRDLLLGHRGTTGTIRLLGVFDVTESDDAEQPIDGDEAGRFSVAMTFNVWFREAA